MRQQKQQPPQIQMQPRMPASHAVIADRDRLTGMVLAAMNAGMKLNGPGHYSGGPSVLLSQMFFAWGVVATPETLRNRTCGKFRDPKVVSFSETALKL